MYAHQVIEDLEKQHINRRGVYTGNFLNLLVQNIKTSQMFHFGEGGAIADVFKGNFGDATSSDRVRIPYHVCFFDFETPRNPTFKKCAFLLMSDEIDNFIFITPFHQMASIKQWVPYPVIFQMPFIGQNRMMSKPNPIYAKRFKKEEEDNYSQEAMKIFLPLFIFGCDILNCKNISTQNNEPPLKLNKKRIKSGKQPLFTYKTLVIKPTGKKQESQQAQGLWDNRIHLCRGHFKEYTAEKPLFGKITGRFWWQPSVRGNVKEGVVMKDYKVETPQKFESGVESGVLEKQKRESDKSKIQK